MVKKSIVYILYVLFFNNAAIYDAFMMLQRDGIKVLKGQYYVHSVIFCTIK